MSLTEHSKNGVHTNAKGKAFFYHSLCPPFLSPNQNHLV